MEHKQTSIFHLLTSQGQIQDFEKGDPNGKIPDQCFCCWEFESILQVKYGWPHLCVFRHMQVDHPKNSCYEPNK